MSSAARPSCRGLVVALELPHGLKEFFVRSVPQTTPVEVGAQLPNRGHELARSHLGDELRLRFPLPVLQLVRQGQPGQQS